MGRRRSRGPNRTRDLSKVSVESLVQMSGLGLDETTLIECFRSVVLVCEVALGLGENRAIVRMADYEGYGVEIVFQRPDGHRGVFFVDTDGDIFYRIDRGVPSMSSMIPYQDTAEIRDAICDVAMGGTRWDA